MSIISPFQEYGLEPTNLGPESGNPLGQWSLNGVVIGDGSGGVVFFSHTFPTKYIYSVEAWAASESLGGTLSTFHLSWTPAGPSGSTWNVSADPSITGSVNMFRVRDSRPLLPLSGRAVPTLGALITLTITASVNTNLEIYRGQAWGHYWDKRSVGFPGGLIRPR